MAVPFFDTLLPSPSALIELFELELITAIHGTSTIYRFHAGIDAKGTADIVWAGNSYMAFPITADGFSYSGSGDQLPRPSLKVANIMSTISALLLTLPSGLEGAKVTRIRTHARYLDAVNFPDNINPLGTPDSTTEYPREIFYVDRRKSESPQMVEFELAAAFDLAGVRSPKRQVISSVCTWIYKSVECSYGGALPSCAKNLNDCRNHFGSGAQLPFGGFPGAGSYFS
jgi:lambda family phage minor tail protein L